ncbi:hypothetical protein [Mycolicibacterium porcinum]|nr:hypothetical protein [Mycolicibacterium porcinum]
MTPPLQDLNPKSQERIRELVAAAPPLTGRQRSRLELLFSVAESGGDAG